MVACYNADSFRPTKPNLKLPDRRVNSLRVLQFASNAWIGAVEGAKVRVSMEGKGRCFDIIFGERLWQAVTYEEVDLRGYSTPAKLWEGLKESSGFIMRRGRTNRWATKARCSTTNEKALTSTEGWRKIFRPATPRQGEGHGAKIILG